MTVLFYTGLHYIDALLAEKGNIHPTKHPTRDNAVWMIAELRPIYGNYRALKNASYAARYDPPTRFTDKNIDDLEKRDLASIRSVVGRYIAI